MIKYITNIAQISKPCKEVTLNGGLEIAKKLLSIVDKDRNSIGLAANQIGIDAAVAVVNVKEPIILINPKVIETWDKITYSESCLSIPGKQIMTARYKYIIIKTDNSESRYYFGPAELSTHNKEEIELDKQRLLESIAFQHEIDHLNGLTILDRIVKRKPTIINKTFGRNEKVTITNGEFTKVLKWKKAEKLIGTDWQILK